jgi:hypothetical protein
LVMSQTGVPTRHASTSYNLNIIQSEENVNPSDDFFLR